jgi:hypothetical protein
MNPLSPDDLPPSQSHLMDYWLRKQLEQVTSHYFYENCDQFTRDLLALCQWNLTTQGNALTLVIFCPNSLVNWRVLNHINTFARLLDSLAQSAIIRVYPPFQQGEPLEVRVDERMVYGDVNYEL